MEIEMSNNEEKTINYFTIIPLEIENDDRLTCGAKYLYGKIKALSNKEGFCWASNKYLAKIIKASVSSIKRWKNILINNGYIKSEIIYKGGTKEVAGRKLVLNDVNQGKFNLNRGVGSNWATNNINNNRIDYYSNKERNSRAHAYVNKSTNFEIEKELEKSKNFEKHLENLKNKYSKVQATKEPEQLKEVYQNCAQTQVEQNSKSIDESNSQLKEVSPDCTNNQGNNDLVSKYSEIFDFELKSKYQNSHINHRAKENQTQYKNNTESEESYTLHDSVGRVKNSQNYCSRSMELYGRESFDEITARRVSNTEERVKLGKYLAFLIRRFGNITNDFWNTFLDRYFSLSNVLEKRLANLDYSFSGGYSNIFSAPKNEFRSKIQYAAISIFE